MSFYIRTGFHTSALNWLMAFVKSSPITQGCWRAQEGGERAWTVAIVSGVTLISIQLKVWGKKSLYKLKQPQHRPCYLLACLPWNQLGQEPLACCGEGSNRTFKPQWQQQILNQLVAVLSPSDRRDAAPLRAVLNRWAECCQASADAH